VRELTADSNPNPLATISQMEQAMHFSLREHVLAQLQGEITSEVNDLADPPPAWAAILRLGQQFCGLLTPIRPPQSPSPVTEVYLRVPKSFPARPAPVINNFSPVFSPGSRGQASQAGVRLQ
jgi:hypothetical protein